MAVLLNDIIITSDCGIPKKKKVKVLLKGGGDEKKRKRIAVCSLRLNLKRDIYNTWGDFVAGLFLCVCVWGGGSGAFYRHSIVTLTQHLQAPVTVNEEGAMKDLAGVKRMEGMS